MILKFFTSSVAYIGSEFAPSIYLTVKCFILTSVNTQRINSWVVMGALTPQPKNENFILIFE